jgi:cellulose biosynthesis protein BcsQ
LWGGCGKSTLAIGLAVAAAQMGERVSLLDTDRQGTVSNWRGRRSFLEPSIWRKLRDGEANAESVLMVVSCHNVREGKHTDPFKAAAAHSDGAREEGPD